MSLGAEAEERARILAAADRLGRRQGDAFTMAELARAAGMSRATLYRRVGDRAAVLAALRGQGVPTPPTPRERLLTATLELLGERGPLGFGLEDVAARAQASVATIYREFGDREGLVREAVASLGAGEPPRELLADTDAPLRPTLEAFVAAAIVRVESQPLLLRVVLTQDAAGWGYLQRVRDRESALSRALLGYIEDQQRRGRIGGASAEEATAALMGLVLGDVILGRRFAADRRVRESAAARARSVVAIFLDGLGRRTRRARAR